LAVDIDLWSIGGHVTIIKFYDSNVVILNEERKIRRSFWWVINNAFHNTIIFQWKRSSQISGRRKIFATCRKRKLRSREEINASHHKIN
jgi:hypothetical protein